MRKFTITTPQESIQLDANGKGEIAFTVTNVSGAPERGMALVVPQAATQAAWLTIAGESDREFAVNGVNQYVVAIELPSGTPAGSYAFRLDVVSARKTGEDHEEGPIVKFAASATAKKPDSRWWIWVAAALVIVVLGVGGYLAFRPHPPGPAPIPDPVPAPPSGPTHTFDPARVIPVLPYGPDTCKTGFVWREAFPEDHVCVTPQTRAQAARDNELAAGRRSPHGGPWGPDSCRQGFVWRDASPDDHV
ncbi:MAG: hypothetical protein WBX15_10515, partial [Thermoanaerobaculia bacterium]